MCLALGFTLEGGYMFISDVLNSNEDLNFKDVLLSKAFIYWVSLNPSKETDRFNRRKGHRCIINTSPGYRFNLAVNSFSLISSSVHI